MKYRYDNFSLPFFSQKCFNLSLWDCHASLAMTPLIHVKLDCRYLCLHITPLEFLL